MISNLYRPRIRPLVMPALVFAAMLTTGCATGSAARSSAGDAASVSASSPDIASVIKQPDVYQDHTVSWGGNVVAVENREDATWIEVISRPLNRSNRPVSSRLSNGRFVAVVPGFLDPADYAPGRVITVSGNIDGSETRTIGQAKVEHPKVLVEDHQLWLRSNTRVAGNRYRYSPYRGRLLIGIGRHGSLGFGFGSRFGFYGSHYDRFGYSRYGYNRFRHSRFGHRRNSNRTFRRRH